MSSFTFCVQCIQANLCTAYTFVSIDFCCILSFHALLRYFFRFASLSNPYGFMCCHLSVFVLIGNRFGLDTLTTTLSCLGRYHLSRFATQAAEFTIYFFARFSDHQKRFFSSFNSSLKPDHFCLDHNQKSNFFRRCSKMVFKCSSRYGPLMA